MFVDCVEIFVSSGKGGEGAVSFRREKFVINGGPDGGDGGRGGDVYFQVDKNTNTLSAFRGHKHFKAQNGRPGAGRNKYGRKGEDLIIAVPPGTQVFDSESNALLLDLLNDERKVLFLEGGKGGLGNVHFKSATNQRPTYAQKGLPGSEKMIRLELKLIADVGLVGFPNVGKSTLVSVLSNAKPKIANYEFTTVNPSLGIVNVDDYQSFIIADIPGIIGGASEGKGLGIEFLRHIERTQFLLFVLDLANYRDLQEQFRILRLEINQFSEKLKKRPFGILFSKSDILENAEDLAEDFITEMDLKLRRHGEIARCFVQKDATDFALEFDLRRPLFAIVASSINGENIESLKYLLYASLQDIKRLDALSKLPVSRGL